MSKKKETVELRTIRAWYQAITLKYERLTAEAERELLIRAHSGDRKAEEELVLRNLRLVASQASEIMAIPGHGRVSFEDLIQAGNIGLLKAIRKFDPYTYEVRLSTYAYHHIKNEMILLGEDRLVALPRGVQQKHRELFRARRNLAKKLSRTPLLSELAHELKMSTNDVQALISCIPEMFSTEEEVCSGVSFIDTLCAPENIEVSGMRGQAVDILLEVLGKLDPEDAHFFVEYFEKDTHEEVQDFLQKYNMAYPRLSSARMVRIRTRIQERLRRKGIVSVECVL